MRFNFDYYRNLEDMEFDLCNPDRTPISPIIARNRSLTLRFNDLSEVTFEAPKYANDATGNPVELPYYDRVATWRLVYIDRIGWFQITEVTETEDGFDSFKTVKMESHQCVLKDRGFYVEERVYKFYDPTDPYDEKYDASDEAQLPSVVGQLYQQLGVKVNLQDFETEITEDYGDWTIVHIPAGLQYDASATENVCRTMTSSDTKYGYDFIINDVENAFEVIFDFDILHHAITIKTIDEITEKTNIYLSFDNLVQQLDVTEKADEIVTVLSCNGQDLDIRMVNPTGTNYIADFSYYMDEVNYHWMSKELIAKLKDWDAAVDSKRDEYKELVKQLRALYDVNTDLHSREDELSLRIDDLERVRDQYIEDQNGTSGFEFISETVENGKKSFDEDSDYYTTPLDLNATITAYKDRPDQSGGKYVFSGDSKTGTFQECYDGDYLYFSCTSKDLAYGKIVAKAKVNPDEPSAQYVVSGYEETAQYKDVYYWLNAYSAEYDKLEAEIEENESDIDDVTEQMTEISSKLNLQNYMSEYPGLYEELRHYWREGDYEDEYLAVLDSTTLAEELDLAEELMAAGEKELSRVCQPRFSFVVTAANFLGLREFQQFSYELQIGRVVTIEKNENTFFYPALTEITFNLDDMSSFDLTFSNAYKLSDWGFTFADLITEASNTARTVSANWTELTSYSKDKGTIDSLLYNPLDKTLRMAQSNMVNQEFVIDTTGILGRKRVDDGGQVFEQEQVRMLNNLIVFTDDGWQTAKTALGKIIYNEDGQDKTAYGLLAEVVVGSLIMGNTMKIINESESIVMDADGITIKSGNDISFTAGTDGNVFVRGDIEATSLTLSSSIEIPQENIKDLAQSFEEVGDNIDALGDHVALWITDDGKLQKLPNGEPTEGKTGFVVSQDGLLQASNAIIYGQIFASGGTIGGLIMNENSIKSSNGVFSVDSSGNVIATSLKADGLIANDVQISGDIVANSLTLGSNVQVPAGNVSGLSGVATSGSYDDLSDKPYIPSLAGYIYENGTVGQTPAEGATGFRVSSSGLLQASNAIIYGTIYASAGTIGGIVIEDNEIKSSDGEFYLKNDGTIRIKKGEIDLDGGSSGHVRIDSSEMTFSSGDQVTIINNLGVQIGVQQGEQNLLLRGGSVSCENGLSLGGAGGSNINMDTPNKINIVAGEVLAMGDWEFGENVTFRIEPTVSPSDIRVKNSITDIEGISEAFFDSLRPITFKYNSDEDGHIHYGLIANEVEESLKSLGRDPEQWALYTHKKDFDTGEMVRALQYREFIPLNICEIQKLKKRVKELEEVIKELKDKL